MTQTYRINHSFQIKSFQITNLHVKKCTITSERHSTYSRYKDFYEHYPELWPGFIENKNLQILGVWAQSGPMFLALHGSQRSGIQHVDDGTYLQLTFQWREVDSLSLAFVTLFLQHASAYFDSLHTNPTESINLSQCLYRSTYP